MGNQLGVFEGVKSMLYIIQEISLQCLIRTLIHFKGMHRKKSKRPNGSRIFYVDERGIYVKDYKVDDEPWPSGQSILSQCL